MRLRTVGMLAVLLLGGLMAWVWPAADGDTTRFVAPIQIARADVADTVPLGDLVSGKHMPGFFPVLEESVEVRPRPGVVSWLRVRYQIPEGGGAGWFLRVDRAPFDRLSLYDGRARLLDEVSFLKTPAWDGGWSEGFALALPSGNSGTVYLRIEGSADAELRPVLLDGTQLSQRREAASRLFVLAYLTIVLAAVLAVLPWVRGVGTVNGLLAMVSLLALITLMLLNDHVPLAWRGALGGMVGATQVHALTILLAGSLILLARQQAGLAVYAPNLSLVFHRLGWLMLVMALVGAVLPSQAGDLVRRLAEFLWAQAWVLVMVAHLQDRRRLRWILVGALTLLMAMLLARGLATSGILSPSAMALFGWQVMLGMLLLVVGLIPSLRRLPMDLALTRGVQAPPSLDEQWAGAERKLFAILDDVAQHAPLGADTEAQWARHLGEALRPLLGAGEVAVAHGGIHQDIRLFCDPPGSRPRFEAAIEEHGRAFRPLVRMGTPQVILLPPQQGVHGQLALLPLASTDNDWTAVLARREAGVFDPDLLGRACELARVSRARFDDRRAEASQTKRDAVSTSREVLSNDGIQRLLRQSFDRCRDLGEPFSVLRVGLGDDSGHWETDADAVAAAIRDLDIALPLELARSAADEVLLALPRHDVAKTRALGNRIRDLLVGEETPESGITEKGRRPKAAPWPMGIAALAAGERVPMPLLARSSEALANARVPGSQAIQAVVPVKH